MNNKKRWTMFELRKEMTALLLSLLLFGQVFAQTTAPAVGSLSATEKEIAEKITIAAIKEYTTALAAPEMEGRGTMQPGGDKAANWIAERFQKFGLKPLGDKGSYLQKIEFKEIVATPETMFKAGDETLAFGTDYGILPMNNGNKDVSGDMVFVAYGIVADSIKRNDLAGIDVQGKIVVMLEGPPANLPKEAWKKQKASMIFMQNLMQKGAAAIVFIGHGREDNPPDELISYFSRRQISMPDEEGYPAFVPPIIYVGSKGAEKLFAKSGVTVKDALQRAEGNDFKPIKLNQKGRLVAKYKSTKGLSSNVVGVLEGSDPKLKEEAVLFSAHYDAYGKEGDKIYYGAADNALGTSEMLAVAEAYSKLSVKPKRSMIFLAVTGEEYGLYGSKYWAKKPTWDIKKIAANLNLDGVGTEVYAPVKTMVGYGAEHSSLGAMLEDVAKVLEIKVVPDPVPDEKVFYRSDHYSFVERGVPALMLMGAPEGDIQVAMKRMKEWEKTDYHQPGDVIQPNWVWQGAETVAEVMGILGWRISEMEKMPEWLSTGRFAKLERGNTKELPKEQ
ncbi:MAG TPA: M28 family peptidase [Pyrinomonadaceae bacterium]|nr:M28 family peptidase [Pyrinomonadaceae bacterium]